MPHFIHNNKWLKRILKTRNSRFGEYKNCLPAFFIFHLMTINEWKGFFHRSGRMWKIINFDDSSTESNDSIWFDSSTIIYSLMSHLVLCFDWQNQHKNEQQCLHINPQWCTIQNSVIELIQWYAFMMGCHRKLPCFYRMLCMAQFNHSKYLFWSQIQRKIRWTQRTNIQPVRPLLPAHFFFALQITHVNRSDRKNINSSGTKISYSTICALRAIETKYFNDYYYYYYLSHH